MCDLLELVIGMNEAVTKQDTVSFFFSSPFELGEAKMIGPRLLVHGWLGC